MEILIWPLTVGVWTVGQLIAPTYQFARAEAFVLVAIQVHIKIAETKGSAVLQIGNKSASESCPIGYDAMLANVLVILSF